MAAKQPDPADPGRTLFSNLDRPPSVEEVASFGKLRAIRDRSYRVRAIVKAWKDQQTQDRQLREKYAHWLLVALGAQAVAVNAAFFLIGSKLLAVEEWTARAFVLAVFGEAVALVLFVVRYLFPPPSDAILKYLDEPEDG